MSENKSPDFESIKQTNPYGQVYWSARDLALRLGYIQWRNFEQAIKKAMIACAETGNIVEQHFADASKSSPMPHGGIREIKNTHLACWSVLYTRDREVELAISL